MIIRVTEALARTMLDNNDPFNRPIELNRVFKYLKELNNRGNGTWSYVPLLEVDEAGLMVNGQHHLLAIVMSNVHAGQMDLRANAS